MKLLICYKNYFLVNFRRNKNPGIQKIIPRALPDKNVIGSFQKQNLNIITIESTNNPSTNLKRNL
jgi:hypothetical protein